MIVTDKHIRYGYPSNNYPRKNVFFIDDGHQGRFEDMIRNWYKANPVISNGTSGTSGMMGRFDGYHTHEIYVDDTIQWCTLKEYRKMKIKKIENIQ